MDKKTNEARWEFIGVCGVDAGLLMIGDPCYFVGTDRTEARQGTWREFLAKQKGRHQLTYKLGHPGLGVMARTASGDGTCPVFGFKRPGDDRAAAMLVVTGQERELPPAVIETLKRECPEWLEDNWEGFYGDE